MDKYEPLNIGIAVYNESKMLKKTLTNLRSSILQLNLKERPNLFVCFNGCNDDTISYSINILEDLESNLAIHILSSKRGKLRAHQTIIENVNNNRPIIFMDADVFVNSAALKKLLDILSSDENVMVASAYPYVIEPKNLRLYHRIIFPIINIKRIYPEIEICKNNVDIFHPNAKSDFERKSRVYFHGRCFIIRDKYLYKFPENFSDIVGDDSFLSFVVLKDYPPGSIKVIYDAKVYSRPQLSIKSYLKSWLRIRKDIDNINKEYPEFLSLKKYVKMKTNWKFVIYNLSLSYKIYAILFYFLRLFEVILYKIKADKIDLNKIWQYKLKEETT